MPNDLFEDRVVMTHAIVEYYRHRLNTDFVSGNGE